MKDPAVLFYSQDFLTGTMLMTNEQKGKYITLLCLQHQNGGLKEKDMLKICGEYDEDIFKKFELIDGCYYNKRMVIESEKRKRFVESRKRNLEKKDDDMDSHKEGHVEEHMDALMEIRNKKYEIRNKKIENAIGNNKELRETKFVSDVYQFSEKYPKEMLQKFISYWTEPNKSNTKMLWEFKKTFEISRRLATWASRDKDIIKPDQLFSHQEMLDLTQDNPEKWKNYEMIKIGDKPMYKLKK